MRLDLDRSVVAAMARCASYKAAQAAAKLNVFGVSATEVRGIDHAEQA